MAEPKTEIPGRNPVNKMTSQIFSRFDWDARPPRHIESMDVPVTRVVSLWSNIDPCTTTDECKARVRELQRRHMDEKNMPDIQHHFIVGGDGNIYEGRGWQRKGHPYPSWQQFSQELTGNSIEIGFIGRPGGKPDDRLLQSASDCVAFGLILRNLQEKVLFFWRSSEKIEYLSHHETNAPGASHKDNFTDHDLNKYEKTRNKDSSVHENAGLKSSRTSSRTNQNVEHENAGFKNSKTETKFNIEEELAKKNHSFQFNPDGTLSVEV